MRIIIVFLVATVALVSGAALQKWHHSADGSRFYIDSENKYNWYEAWNECSRKNMSLIAIDTYEKHLQIDALIHKLFSVSPSFWLAGHDNAIDLHYEWATTGESFTFTNWGPSQPDRLNNNEHCILIWQGTWVWYDLPCGHKLGFICEENRFLKEKNHEVEKLKMQCQDAGNNAGKYKNVALYINSNITFGNSGTFTQRDESPKDK